MASSSEGRGARPALGTRALVALSVVLVALGVALAGCDAVLGIPGHLDAAGGAGGSASGASGASGSSATGGGAAIVLRDGKLGALPAAPLESGALRVTQHAFELRERACDDAHTVCVFGALTAQGATLP